MAPSGNTNALDDVNRGPQLLAIFWTETAVCIIVVSLRIYVRKKLHIIGWDDITMAFTLIMYVVTTSLCSVLVSYGLGRHIEFVPLDQQVQVLKWNWLVQPFAIMTLPPGKISVTLLLLRLMSPKTVWRKWALWVNMVIFTLFFVLASIFSFVQCNPPRALWEEVPNAHCWNPKIQATWAVTGSAYSAVLDFLLALMPVTIVWDLQLTLKRKIALCILLGLGVLSGVCAAIKTAQARKLEVRTDVTWALFSLYAWSVSEIFLNILCGSLPTLMPLYEALFHGRPLHRGPNWGRSDVYELEPAHSQNRNLIQKFGSLSAAVSHVGDKNSPHQAPMVIHRTSDFSIETEQCMVTQNTV